MKHIKLFNEDSDRVSYEYGENYFEPYVSYVEEDHSVYYSTSPFFCKLTLNNGNLVKLEGSGELTRAMVSDQYKDTLVSAEIGELCTSIGTSAFHTCSGLTSITIPDSVTSIGPLAFYSCSSLTSVTIPNSVTNIGANAFSVCSGLTSIVVDSDNTIYDSRLNCNAIIETASNSLIRGCENTVIPNNVTSIGATAFASCSGLTNITIPNSVTSIGSGAFASCDNLTSITIPNSVISISDGTFASCSGLTTITIPNSVTSIGLYAFSGCSGLTSVIIGSGVTSIGSSAFYGCSNLFTVTSHIVNAPSVNSGTFANVKNGGTLYVPIGSSGYETWMNNQGNLGLYNWTKVEQ